VGPWRDPVRNARVVDVGHIACGLLFPFVAASLPAADSAARGRGARTSLGLPGVIIGSVDEDEEYEELVCILEPFRNMRIETGPVTLTQEYVRMVEEVESAPENQSGADKTWVEVVFRQSREHFAGARRYR
jgi:hypothetical protein